MPKLRRLGRLLVLAGGLAAAGAALAEVVPEAATVRTLPPSDGRRVYLPDIVFNHMVDGRVHVVDGGSLRYLGLVSMGFAGLFAPSPDGTQLYAVGTFYERLTRGARTDAFMVYDARTLSLVREVVIPPRHAQAIPYGAYLVPAGPHVLVQNAEPGSSVTVVDPVGGRVLGEVETAGCFGIYPSAGTPGRFSSLCGDGTVLTVTLDADGRETSRRRSGPVFDAAADPLFIAGAAHGGRTYFVSYAGTVHVLDLTGEVARLEGRFSLVTGADRAQNWRPGGRQLLAIHGDTQRLLVLMHRGGGEGSHKRAADQLWQVDLRARRVAARSSLPGAVSVAAAAGAPLVFTLNEDGSLLRHRLEKGRLAGGARMGSAAESATTLMLR